MDSVSATSKNKQAGSVICPKQDTKISGGVTRRVYNSETIHAKVVQ